MRFSKWHALGNAYLLVERADLAEPLAADEVRALCDGRRGVGADGVLEVGPADGDVVSVRVWNPDGSTAELSGNGARIAAAWAMGRTGEREAELRVGERVVRAVRAGGGQVEVDLGPVEVGTPETVEVAGERVELTPVSVGNPHAVVRREPTREALLRLGPLVECHPRFPERTNVQLVRVDGSRELTVRVWERGAGETESSGSSAVAAAATAVARGWCVTPTFVHLPGGTLRVELCGGRALLTGPAVEVVRGETLPGLAPGAVA